MSDNKKHKAKLQKGLSDKELIAKYDTGEKVDFDKAVKLMMQKPKGEPLNKPKK